MTGPAARLPTRLIVDTMVRAAQAAGGFAMILARGDAHGGMILVQCRDRDTPGPLLERQFDGDWVPVGPAADSAPDAMQDYLDRRRRIDPDLWVIELDIPEAPQFIARLTPKT